MSVLDRVKGWLDRRVFGPLRGLTKASGESIFASLTSLGGMFGHPARWGHDKLEQARHYRLWTYVAIRAIAETVAKNPPQVAYRRRPDQAGPAKGKRFLSPAAREKALTSSVQAHEELEAVDSDHPLYKLLQNPNRPDVSFSFWYRTVVSAETTGEFYWMKVRNRLGLPVELWPIFPHWVTPIPGRERLVDRYEIRPYGGGAGGEKTFEVDADDMVVCLYPSPLSLIHGWSPLSAGAEWVDASEAIDSDRWYHFEGGMWPGMVLELDPATYGRAGPDEPTLRRMYAQLDERLKGKEKAGRPIVLSPGMKAGQTTRSPAEMAYVDSAAQLRDWTLALHRVSKTVAGLADDVNRASMVASLANYMVNTINPKFTLMGQIATEQLAADFDEDLVVFWPDLTPQDPEQVNADIDLDLRAGAITPNEVRKKRGLAPFEFGGDDPILPNGVGVVPWGTGSRPEDDELAEMMGGRPTSGGPEKNQEPGDAEGPPE